MLQTHKFGLCQVVSMCLLSQLSDIFSISTPVFVCVVSVHMHKSDLSAVVPSLSLTDLFLLQCSNTNEHRVIFNKSVASTMYCVFFTLVCLASCLLDYN